MSVLDDIAGAAVHGLRLYARGLRATERVTLQILRARMDQVAPPKQLAATTNGSGEESSPREVLAALLERSLSQNAPDGWREADLAALSQLVPDEARILASLAQGTAAPLLHVLARGGGDILLENASLIGRLAGVTLPSRTPAYVTHLRELGLVEAAPQDRANKQGYELLMADRDVRKALKHGELGKLPARTVKRTLVLSARGRALWTTWQP